MTITAKSVFTVVDGTYTIAPNLYLRVRGTSRSFVFRYTDELGKRKDKSLGSAKKLSLKDAKNLAIELREKLEKGEELEVKTPTVDESFEAYARKTLEQMIEVAQYKNAVTVTRLRRIFELYVYPIIGNKSVKRVTRNDIYSVIKPLWATKNVTAQLVREKLERVFSYALNDGLTEFNPAVWRGNLDMLLAKKTKVHETKHRCAATLEETREIIKKLRLRFLQERCLFFTILTASRVAEVSLARWVEVDFDSATWSVPPERRKDGKKVPHVVPLSIQALEFLKSLPRNGEYIFSAKGTKPTNPRGALVAVQKYDKRLTVHGFRSTFRDWCAENGVNDTVAEKCLMHATGNAVVQAYQRSDLLELRRPVMQAWADAVCS